MATQPHDRRKFKAAMKKPAAPHRFAKRDQPHGPNRDRDGELAYAEYLRLAEYMRHET